MSASLIDHSNRSERGQLAQLIRGLREASRPSLTLIGAAARDIWPDEFQVPIVRATTDSESALGQTERIERSETQATSGPFLRCGSHHLATESLTPLFDIYKSFEFDPDLTAAWLWGSEARALPTADAEAIRNVDDTLMAEVDTDGRLRFVSAPGFSTPNRRLHSLEAFRAGLLDRRRRIE